MTKAGAYAGFFAGAGTAIVLFFVLGAARSPLASSIAMVVPFFVVPVVSLLTPKTDEEAVRRAFGS